jgi:hypothetical protein
MDEDIDPSWRIRRASAFENRSATHLGVKSALRDEPKENVVPSNDTRTAGWTTRSIRLAPFARRADDAREADD